MIVAVETLFGWSVHGPTIFESINTRESSVGTMNVVARDLEQDDQLESFQLERFWDLESIGINEPLVPSATEDEVLQQFEETVVFNGERNQVRLPWITDETVLSDNIETAKGRLRTLVRRFQRNLPLYVEYKVIIEEHLEKGIAEEIYIDNTVSTNSRALFYLPHQAIIRRDKATTKMRFVFDASAHDKETPSLNNLLHAGPNMNPDLMNLLIKFRRNRHRKDISSNRDRGRRQRRHAFLVDKRLAQGDRWGLQR